MTEGREEEGGRTSLKCLANGQSEAGAPVECQTPETLYEIGMSNSRTLQVRMRFPFEITDWAMGNSVVTEGPKLQRYDQYFGEQKRITDLIHDCMEAVGADCYRVMRKIDADLGLTRVEDGVAHAKKRRVRSTRKGAK